MKSLEEHIKLANAEMWETTRWFNDEINRICTDLDEKQGNERKFDGGNEPYVEVHKEFARRMKAIGEKYGLLQNKKDATQMTLGE